MNVSFPVPPSATSGELVPRLSQPRVVATVATSNTFSAARLPLMLPELVRRRPYSWPIWNESSPAPPSSVVVVALSSAA